MNMLDEKLAAVLKNFVENVEEEYKIFMAGLNASMNPNAGTPEQRSKASVNFARQQGVREDRIMNSSVELRCWLESDKK